MGPIPGFLIGLATNAIFRQRDDFFVRRDFGASIQDVGHQQRRVLHRHGSSLLQVECFMRSSLSLPFPVVIAAPCCARCATAKKSRPKVRYALPMALDAL